MAINIQASRIKLHTVTSAGAFTVPASEDFTDGSWTIYDLLKSEIGVNENDGKAFIRIGNTVKELQTDAPVSTNLGTSDLTSTDDERIFTLAGSSSIHRLKIQNASAAQVFSVNGLGSFAIGIVNSANHRITATDEGGFSIRAANATNTNMGSLSWFSGSQAAQFFSKNGWDIRGGANNSAIRFITYDGGGVGTNTYIYQGNLHIGTAESHGSRGALIMENNNPPTVSRVDKFAMYSADAGIDNAAPFFRTENDDIVRLYSQDNTISGATVVSNVGTTVTDADTFAGFTLAQIAQALINNGLLK